MRRVFSTESEFLAAPPETRHNRKGYRVKHGEQTFFVWAISSTQAMGLVAREIAVLTTVPYRQKEVEYHANVEIDSKLIAVIAALDPRQQAKLRVMLKQGFRDDSSASV